MKSKMVIQDFEVAVHLGCSPEEQKYLQPVRFDFEIQFQSEVKAMRTDSIIDAVDYTKLTTLMKSEAKKKNYHLVEHLNHEVLSALVKHLQSLPLKADLRLSVHKVRVPIESLKNGVRFTCEASI
jgi:dihydroneopterin aldolase